MCVCPLFLLLRSFFGILLAPLFLHPLIRFSAGGRREGTCPHTLHQGREESGDKLQGGGGWVRAHSDTRTQREERESGLVGEEGKLCFLQS